MDGQSLEIRKLSYSRSPWRICLGEFELQMFWFDRKRDAKPYLEKLLAVGDWSRRSEFSEAQERQVAELMSETECYKSYAALVNRQATAWWL